MEELRFERQYRTPHSEGYLMFASGERLGRLDVQFSSSIVYGTMIVERELEEDEILEVIEQADDEIVMTADVPRDDFIVSVYQGRDVGTYSDDYDDEDDEEGDASENGA